jgi:hypothetical protein
VEEHDTEDDCWTVIGSNIYDFSNYTHSGPQSVITAVCGIDGTESFNGRHAMVSDELLGRIESLIVANYIEVQTVTVGGSGDSGGAASGGGGSSSGGGSSGGSGADVFCFTGEALVEMADGTLKPIADVEEGDVVRTGTGHGAGRVTEKLAHQIGGEVPVTMLDTEHGVLMGTPSHPVLSLDGEWINFGDMKHDLLRTSTRYIDVFYNLEIDADTPESSSHSYVVNGVVASGLGDNEVLNRLYPRQESWKNKVNVAVTA